MLIALAAAASPAWAQGTNCRTSSENINVGGRIATATVEACPQADGSWHVVQRTPGLPDQEYVVPATPAAAGPLCHDYTLPVTVSGRVVTANGRACLMPDGSWQVVQNTPGLPVQSYTVPPPPPAAAAQTVAPEYWGWTPWPWYFGLGPTFVVIQRHHFHHHLPMPMPAHPIVRPPPPAPPPAMHRR